MLDYLRKRMAGPDSLIISVETADCCFERAGIVAIDGTGIVIDSEVGTYCVPWGVVLQIEIEE